MAARKARREKRLESFGNVGDMLGVVHDVKSHTAGIMIVDLFLYTQKTMTGIYTVRSTVVFSYIFTNSHTHCLSTLQSVR